MNNFEERKQEIQLDYQNLLIETGAEIEKIVLKKLEREKVLRARLAKVEAEEKEKPAKK